MSDDAREPKKSTLERLVDELFDAYPDDPSTPGVVVSKIKETPRPRYYVSVVRYMRPLGGDRRVVTSVRMSDLALAIREVARRWRERRDDAALVADEERERRGKHADACPVAVAMHAAIDRNPDDLSAMMEDWARSGVACTCGADPRWSS